MSGSIIVASMNYAFAFNGDGQATTVNNAGTPNPGAPGNVVLTSGYDPFGDRTSLSATIAGTADFSNTYAFDGDQNLTMVQQQGISGGDEVSQKEIDYGYNALGKQWG